MAAEYSDAYEQFMTEAAKAYQDMVRRIHRGEVKKDVRATVSIQVPPATIDRIRQDLLLAEAAINVGTRNGSG